MSHKWSGVTLFGNKLSLEFRILLFHVVTFMSDKSGIEIENINKARIVFAACEDAKRMISK